MKVTPPSHSFLFLLLPLPFPKGISRSDFPNVRGIVLNKINLKLQPDFATATRNVRT